MRPYFLEACVTSPDQAIKAEQGGADRLELCARLETGGMTPDYQLTKEVLEQVDIPVRVMIREEATGFAAEHDVLEDMIAAIRQFKSLPIEGFVFGVMKNEKVDQETMTSLLQAAAPYPVTFHKAIDDSTQLVEDLLWMNRFPQIDFILTSGGAAHAIEGLERILEIKSHFSGKVIGAGKIKPEDLPGLHSLLELDWYHGRAITG